MTTPADYPLIYLGCLAVMLVCRVVPLFALRGHDLSDRVSRAFGLIPVAAFAALVANDVLDPAGMAIDPVGGLIPLVAAVPVVAVARKTGSLIWSAVVGMAVYTLLAYVL